MEKMVIVHLTGYFKLDVMYQENLLCKGLAELTHDVHVLAGDLEPDFIVNKNSRKIHSKTEFIDGFTVHRMKPTFELKKNALTYFPGVYKKLKKLNPDVIFIHDNGLYLFSALYYKFLNNKVILLWDSHSDYTNSLNSKFGKIWHKFFGLVLNIFNNYFKQFYYIAPEMGVFVRNEYFLKKKTSLLRLPGIDSISDELKDFFEQIREKDTFIIFHTGKLPQLKKTYELYQACINLPFKWKLIIAGEFTDDHEAQSLKNSLSVDNRVDLLGWKSPLEIRTIMFISDIIAQPGSLSNSFLDAACVGAPLLLASSPMANDIVCEGNGFLIQGKIDNESIKNGLIFCHSNIKELKKNSLKVKQKFHYLTISKQVEKDILD